MQYIKELQAEDYQNMTLKHLLAIILLTICFGACNEDKRQQQLNEREQALMQREMDFAAKSADYQSLLQMRDSLLSNKSDTTITAQWPEEITGSWNGKSLCRESNCSDYVVGDQRSDTWVFASDSTSIFTKILNKDILLRIYNAEIDGTEIRLHYKSDSTATRKVEIKVILTPSGSNLMKGTQTISVNNSCTAKFSLELTRSNP